MKDRERERGRGSRKRKIIQHEILHINKTIKDTHTHKYKDRQTEIETDKQTATDNNKEEEQVYYEFYLCLFDRGRHNQDGGRKEGQPQPALPQGINKDNKLATCREI